MRVEDELEKRTVSSSALRILVVHDSFVAVRGPDWGSPLEKPRVT